MSSPPAPPDRTQGSYLRRLWLTALLIAICVGVEAVLILADWGIVRVPRLRLTVYEYAGFWPGLLRGLWQPNYTLQPWLMFFTYAFLHSGPGHLLVNMVTFWSLSEFVHQRVGTLRLAFLYTVAVIGGGLGFGLLTQSAQPMVGASGGLFGLAGSLLAWDYKDRLGAAQRLWPVALWVGGLLGLNLVQWWLMDGLLAWQAHLGGFIFGWITARLIDPGAKDQDQRTRL